MEIVVMRELSGFGILGQAVVVKLQRLPGVGRHP